MNLNKININNFITTHDNPYNPLEDFDNWNQWDIDHEYHTFSLILRYSNISVYDDPQTSEDKFVEAMEQLLEHDTHGIYKLI